MEIIEALIAQLSEWVPNHYKFMYYHSKQINSDLNDPNVLQLLHHTI